MIKVTYNPFDILFRAIGKVNDISANLVFTTKDQCDGNWGYAQKNEDGTYIIGIAVELSLQDALEIIAHEAAHIMAKSHEKPEEDQHDREWEFWFDNIQKQYEHESIEALGREEKGK